MTSRPRAQVVAAALVGVLVGAGFWWLRWRGDEVAVMSRDTEVSFPQPSGNELVGRPLPGTTALTRLDGTELTMGDLVGQPLVVNVWFTTCPPCRQEMPAFDTVADDLDGRVSVVGLDAIDTPDAVRSFATDLAIGYELLIDPTGDSLDALGIVAFPTTLFVTPDGTVAHVQVGPVTEADLRSLISDHLGVA